MTESSGVFTFPATGYWLIRANGEFYLGSSNSRYNILQIKTTVNNGVAWTETGGSMQMVPDSASGHYGSTSNMFLFDVTDTANCKVSFRSGPQNAATATQGSSTADSTYFTFVRLADT